ncbi:BON domain-containing protein [Noviherbaspirillum sp.]|uniref:BON domain-containing protein n=1 Tax=Noviherbaspirillum sp. TaxID=1926288 RepID=UPI002B4A91CF|nr:BON domain-containing protein [Noviherbaspirillum sp.]HJV83702.1 BON domain-containing protein [Noviherbaspirillum sp.]
MKAIAATSRVVLLGALLSVAVAGCGRKEADRASGGTTSSASGSSTAGASRESSGTSGNTAAPSSGSSGSSVGAAIDDSIITTKIKSALLADEQVKGTDISVETKMGEVMLSGFVHDKAQIDKAVKIASSVEGVKKVDNKMTVKQ